jgi:hypothetical protein
MRQLFEFYCNDCDGWFLVNLNTSIRGSYLIVCPSCGHEHPRTIQNNEMVLNQSDMAYYTDQDKNQYKRDTDFMVTRNAPAGKYERIVPSISAYSKTPRLNQLHMARGVFLADAWANTVKE